MIHSHDIDSGIIGRVPLEITDGVFEALAVPDSRVQLHLDWESFNLKQWPCAADFFSIGENYDLVAGRVHSTLHSISMTPSIYEVSRIFIS